MDPATLKVVIYYKSKDQQNYEGLKVKPALLMKLKQEDCYSYFCQIDLKEINGFERYAAQAINQMERPKRIFGFSDIRKDSLLKFMRCLEI